LAAPVLALFQPGERLFGVYLLGAFALASWVWWTKLRRRVAVWTFLFSPSIWLHPSALFDLRLMVARSLISAFVFAPLAFSAAHLATRLHLQLRSVCRIEPWTSPTVALVLVSLSAFVMEDLARYLVHRASHRVGALWELHKVHHSAEVLTPLTVYRTHPLEGLMNESGATCGLALGVASCAWLLGANLSAWAVSGVYGISFLWNLTGSNLRHSQVWLSYPRWLQFFFLSPAQHQVHHSQDPQHHNKNFGTAMTLWDRLAGTLYVTGERESLTFGLPAAETNHRPTVLSSIVAPVGAAVLKLWPRRPARSV
jgi:sterol desaturase/sphingolipid hydroxylase (fatty acid hydroxylase superfamily)